VERIKDMGVAGVIGTIVTILSNVLFLLVWKLGLPGFFSASILGQAIPAVYLAVRVKIWKYIGTVIDKTLQKEMLLYAVPLMMTTIGWWVNTASDKYVVTFICGVAANGLLSIAYKIPTILNTLQGIFIQAWQVSAIKEYGSEEAKRFYRETFLYLNALMCVGCAGLIWLTRPIAHILFAKDFYQAWVFVPFLLVSSMLNAASGYIGPILAAKKDSKSMAIAAFGGAGVNVVLNIALVYLMGIQGATIATVIASYIIYIIRKRATGDAVVSAKYKWIMTSWVVLCIQAACEVWIHNYLITGLLFVVMLFIYRKSILSVGRKLLKR
jgi:Membrane protein involved in the export of O-antigen and teichoic acid